MNNTATRMIRSEEITIDMRIWSFSKPRTQKPSTRRSKSIRHPC